MAEQNKILQKMLDRLLAGLVNGPSLNCRPYASRQRLDFVQLGKLGDSRPADVLRALLGPDQEATLKAKVALPAGGQARKLIVAASIEAADESGIPLADSPNEEEAGEEKSPDLAWAEQGAVLNKLHTIAEDARTYEQDTGVNVLSVGFPLLSLPPGTFGGGSSTATRRVLAPLAFIPVSVTVKRGAAPAIELACKGDGVDRVTPNTALFAWLEQQTGKPVLETDEDEAGTHPWQEICDIVAAVCGAMNIRLPEVFEKEPGADDGVDRQNRSKASVGSAPRTDSATSVRGADPTRTRNDSPPTNGGSEVGAAPASSGSLSPVLGGEGWGEGRGAGEHGSEGVLPNGPSPQPSPPSTGEREPESLPDATADGDSRQIRATPAAVDEWPIVGAALADADVAPPPENILHPQDQTNRMMADEQLDSLKRIVRENTAAAPGGPIAPARNDPTPSLSDEPRPLKRTLRAPSQESHGRMRDLELLPAPRADETGDSIRLISAAVLGLFPMANQGLLRDTQSLLAGGPLTGPIESFVRLGVSLDMPAAPKPPTAPAEDTPKPTSRPALISEERFISGSDPCQARAVRLARECQGLVVHGPPGTGKSQTITNIIGDHLSRGQRVLVVCDKRTALDVVFNRLNHMGLGNLCALVHDPRRDQRELYKSIRQQLDDLAEAKSDARAANKLTKADVELQGLHDELRQYSDALTRRPDEHALNFHELVGEWLALEDSAEPAIQVSGITLAAIDAQSAAVHGILKRGNTVNYAGNPWVAAAGMALAEFLAQPMDKIRAMAASCEESAKAADATQQANIPPFSLGLALAEQAAARVKLADDLGHLAETVDPAILARWANQPATALSAAKASLGEVAAFVQSFRAGPLDAELLENIHGKPLEGLPISAQLIILAKYQEYARKWYAFWPSAAKKDAATVVNGYGLPLSPDNAARTVKFLTGVRSRTKLSTLARTLAHRGKNIAVGNSGSLSPVLGGERWGEGPGVKQRNLPHGPSSQPSPPSTGEKGQESALQGVSPDDLASACGTEAGSKDSLLLADDAIAKSLDDHTATLDFLLALRANLAIRDLGKLVAAALIDPNTLPPLLDGLRKSPPRAAALEKLEEALGRSRLFAADWLAEKNGTFRAGQSAADVLSPLRQNVETLEGVLRIRQGLTALPPELRPAVLAMLNASIEADRAVGLLRREALAGEISTRLAADPQLQEVDAERLESAFNRYRALDAKKLELTRDAIQHCRLSRQQERLLAGAGSRVNSLGADLRRRLMLRGERAMRLRQVVDIGRKIEGGDPLFDICPVWLCSPETVAQVFPREAVFDVLVFDEASQMRLEESLPVLVRAKRVVIAGDPKQLPPTRFFESAVASSQEDDAQTDQDLFEQQQGEIEDLLGAALGLDIQQCYLDVHYRSRHADLIAFSNEYFYSSRLQPIPGHPSNVAPSAPVELEHIAGIYDRRCNEAEAVRIVQIIEELLSRQEPPSIGVACFNLVQRDLVAEKLDELAAENPAFARRLEKARTRQGVGSFEGLFIKNLENVQGDERDYILISTTYGPDKAGSFHRRFGPLGRAGGGRRLNVLVTRAREKVHIVSSIPREAYRTLEQPEEGQTPGGTWLLFAYLKFADGLQAQSAAAAGGLRLATPGTDTARPLPDSIPPSPADNGNSAGSKSNGESAAKSNGESAAKSNGHPLPAPAGEVNIFSTKTPSPFAEAFSQKLATEKKIGSDVYWGNEGFSVDIALHHPSKPDDVTIGILCDAARYAAADDPMQWDVFRTGILESQGWKLHRLWTPHFYRDPKGATAAVVAEAAAAAK